MRAVLARGVATVLDVLAAVVTKRRVVVLVPLVIATAVLASQIPNLKADPTPERLLASYEGNDAAQEEEFEKTFSVRDKVMVVLLEAEDVLTQRNLQYVHGLTRHFDEQSWVERAESVTVMPLPRFEAAEEELTLEDLEAEMGGDEGGTAEQELDPGVLDALSALVDTAPQQFPDGLGGLTARMENQLETDPIVQGDKVEEQEANKLREQLQGASLVRGRLLSDDGTVAVVAVELAGEDLGHERVQKATDAVETYVSEHEPPEGAKVHLGGLPYLRSTIVEKMKLDRRVLMPLTMLVCLVLLYLSFRWVAGTVLPLVAVGITAVLVVGGMAVVGEPMNVLNNIVPPLLIIIGISDSIHLIGRYREELSRVRERVRREDGDAEGATTRERKKTVRLRGEAGRETVCHMAVACFLTSLTTSVGMASLLVADTVMLRNFGVLAALGVLVAYMVTITFLPSVLTWVRPPKHVEKMERLWLEKGIVLLTKRVLRKPRSVLMLTGVVLAVCAWGATQVEVDHALLDQFDEEDPVYRTTRLMEEKLGGIRPLEVSLSSSEQGHFFQPSALQDIEEVKAWAMKQPEVIGAMGPGDILWESWQLVAKDPEPQNSRFESQRQVTALGTLLEQRKGSPLEHFVNDERTRARIQLRLKDVGAQQILGFIERLETKLQSQFSAGEVDFAFTGDAYTGSRGLRAVVHDLLGSLLTAIGIIFVLLTVLFRSLRLGLLSIPPNVFPLVVTMAYMVARGIPLNAATVIIFSISIGLAVDGTIHVLARYREETLKGLGSSQALIRAARGTGQAIVVSGVTLTLGFAVLLWSSFVPVRHFGELIAVTVAACLVATLVVQPALLRLAGLPRRAEMEAASL
jgi:hypothetical protein